MTKRREYVASHVPVFKINCRETFLLPLRAATCFSSHPPNMTDNIFKNKMPFLKGNSGDGNDVDNLSNTRFKISMAITYLKSEGVSTKHSHIEDEF